MGPIEQGQSDALSNAASDLLDDVPGFVSKTDKYVDTPMDMQGNVIRNVGGLAANDGASAYDIAVENGFVGTEVQWLASLEGSDGADGADGEDGATGAQGPKGDTGDTGSTGPQGAQGAAGNDGAQGETGDQGPQGIQGNQGTAGTNGTDGTDGVDGKTVLNGAGAPTTEGVDGDFYIDTDADTIYGPKASGVWGSPTSLIGPTGAQGATGDTGATGATGPAGAAGADGSDGSDGSNGSDGADGNTVLYGPGAPSNGNGEDGDFYIDTSNDDIYGPKASGSWPSGTSLVGPAGETGATGPAGETGSAGADGEDGINSPYCFGAKLASDQTGLSSGGEVTVNATEELWDPNDDYDAANKKYVIPVNGVYEFGAALYDNNSQVTSQRYRINVDDGGAGYIDQMLFTDGSGFMQSNGTYQMYLEAGDEITLLYRPNNSANTSLSSISRWWGKCIYAGTIS